MFYKGVLDNNKRVGMGIQIFITGEIVFGEWKDNNIYNQGFVFVNK